MAGISEIDDERAAAGVLEMDYRLHVCHVKRRKHKALISMQK
jgi:hypothetical protein